MMNLRPDFFYQQAGVIPYRLMEGEIEILLITSRRGKRWIVPKGIIEPGQSAVQTALQEANEEAGIIGEITGPALGSFQYGKWGGTLNVVVYAMKVTEELADWPEAEFRDRAWAKFNDAQKTVGFENIKPLMDELKKRLNP